MSCSRSSSPVFAQAICRARSLTRSRFTAWLEGVTGPPHTTCLLLRPPSTVSPLLFSRLFYSTLSRSLSLHRKWQVELGRRNTAVAFLRRRPKADTQPSHIAFERTHTSSDPTHPRPCIATISDPEILPFLSPSSFHLSTPSVPNSPSTSLPTTETTAEISLRRKVRRAT